MSWQSKKATRDSQIDKIVDTASHAIKQFVTFQQLSSGLPNSFWEDAYVIGFFYGFTAFFANFFIHEEIDKQDLDAIVRKTFDQVSRPHSEALFSRAKSLLAVQDPDFIKSKGNAEKYLNFEYGLQSYGDDPDVKLARMMAEVMASVGSQVLGSEAMSKLITNTSKKAPVGAALRNILFHDVVTNRVGRT